MTSAPLILSLETATLAGSIAISRGTNIVASRTGNPKVSHSNTLLADINELLSEVTLTIGEIDLFAVAAGPGSFTGLRIGLATVKALATTLGRDCVGIPTLKAIAHSAGVSDATVTLLPAGRGEVFVQLFSVSSSGTVLALDQPGHLSPGKAIEKYIARDRIRWAGEGADRHSDLIQEIGAKAGHTFFGAGDESVESVTDGWTIAPPPSNLAQHVASLAMCCTNNAGEQTATNLRAIYVRPSDAEMNV
jgi:tRNA threonylcarbamoyladenosine biosynthesis protein TsaB